MKIKQYIRHFALYAFISLALCVGLASTTYAKPSKVMVYMYDSYFSPSTITIHPGQKVVWVNKGHKDHTVVSNNGYFDSGRIHPGGSVSYTFTKPGTFNYYCKFHTFLFFGMKGVVIVK